MTSGNFFSSFKISSSEPRSQFIRTYAVGMVSNYILQVLNCFLVYRGVEQKTQRKIENN
jgi:hypothetical protein